jgi:DNA polymerase-4
MEYAAAEKLEIIQSDEPSSLPVRPRAAEHSQIDRLRLVQVLPGCGETRYRPGPGCPSRPTAPRPRCLSQHRSPRHRQTPFGRRYRPCLHFIKAAFGAPDLQRRRRTRAPLAAQISARSAVAGRTCGFWGQLEGETGRRPGPLPLIPHSASASASMSHKASRDQDDTDHHGQRTLSPVAEPFPMTLSATKQRWVGHADLDAFYASVEQRDHSEYRNRPVVVGALPGHRGVVAAASYQARAFGIHSAMPIAEAYRRCLDAVFLRPDMARYARVSREIFRILETVTPEVEPVSVDEAFLDLRGLEKLFGPPEAIGLEIKRRIRESTGLTVSVGIGPNRLIAKLGSEHRKPDGLTVVHPEQILDFLAPLLVASLRGLGPQTQKVFSHLGISTVAELRAVPLRYLEERLGKKAASSFHAQALGIASAEVVSERARKSISKETTFEEDIEKPEVLHDVLRRLAAEVAATARRENLAGSVVTLKIRFAGFETHSRRHKLSGSTHDERVILREAWELFLHSRLPRKPVRLIGVGISDWQATGSVQTDLFEQPGKREKDTRLLETLDRVSDRFGKGVLQLGCTLKTHKRPP